MVKVWENDPVNSELNSTRVKILESVEKIAISLLYKLHPTEKSSKSPSSHWWESWECILILYFYFHQSTWFQSTHHTLRLMGKKFFRKYSELPGDWPLLHCGRFRSRFLKVYLGRGMLFSTARVSHRVRPHFSQLTDDQTHFSFWNVYSFATFWTLNKWIDLTLTLTWLSVSNSNIMTCPLMPFKKQKRRIWKIHRREY